MKIKIRKIDDDECTQDEECIKKHAQTRDNECIKKQNDFFFWDTRVKDYKPRMIIQDHADQNTNMTRIWRKNFRNTLYTGERIQGKIKRTHDIPSLEEKRKFIQLSPRARHTCSIFFASVYFLSQFFFLEIWDAMLEITDVSMRIPLRRRVLCHGTSSIFFSRNQIGMHLGLSKF